MAEISPVSSNSAAAAFGVGFDDLLKIVLTQLTYQDPLKPMDNAEFVSQLAQFTQIQQTKTMSDNLRSLLEASTMGQAASLLGRTVEVSAQQGVISGRVASISIQSGVPTVTLETADGGTLSGIGLGLIANIKEGN
ncbi:MAG: flagellar basal-body rod modification protein FlgD [Alphaproteobacteria bacterium]|nr:MAG: flagellar basal-body rod modification protein FlgD [Caulobacteraceae bacterium]TPW05203.1 MAG: flagellar basal-body rod modification protein FlgD [Alphaproteobacteria bacterium]